MSVYKTRDGNVHIIDMNPDKVDALIKAIESACLPERRMLMPELKGLKNPEPFPIKSKWNCFQYLECQDTV